MVLLPTIAEDNEAFVVANLGGTHFAMTLEIEVKESEGGKFVGFVQMSSEMPKVVCLFLCGC